VNAGGNFYVAQCNNFEDAKFMAAAPALLEWLTKAAQMAEQQYEGGEDAPLRSAWDWLHTNARIAIEAAS
jgi:hypothetical protein